MNFALGLTSAMLWIVLLFMGLGLRSDRKVSAQQAEQLADLRGEVIRLKASAEAVPALVERQSAHEGRLVACERRTLHLRATLIHLSKMAGLTRLPRPLGMGTWPVWPAAPDTLWDPDGFIRQTLQAEGD